jgi:hypothetical protein
MVTKARDIINSRYNDNWIESRYGSTRSTLFGKFYERILREWLEEKKHCTLMRWQNTAIHKPRIYWRNVSTKGFNFSRQPKLKERMAKALGQKTSHCTPDGVFEKEGRFYIWEAKNWPLYPEKGPRDQILTYFASTPWVLARIFDFSGSQREISGFWFSYWCNSEQDEEEIRKVEQEMNSIIGSERLEIIPTDRILDDCITNRYQWYLKIIKQEKENVEQFCDQLLGMK